MLCQKLANFVEHLTDEGCIEDGTLATDLSKVCHVKLHVEPELIEWVQATALWSIREEITVALVREGVTYKVSGDSLPSSSSRV